MNVETERRIAHSISTRDGQDGRPQNYLLGAVGGRERSNDAAGFRSGAGASAVQNRGIDNSIGKLNVTSIILMNFVRIYSLEIFCVFIFSFFSRQKFFIFF